MYRSALVTASLLVTAWPMPAHADPGPNTIPLPTTGGVRTSTLEYLPGSHPWTARPAIAFRPNGAG